jgi:arylsulfatase A-like enzyme
MNWGVLGSSLPALRHDSLAANLPLPQTPSFNEGNLSDKPGWLTSNFPSLTGSHVNCLTTNHRNAVEAMMAVDDLIGTVVAALQATQELNDTLLVFTSDNGFLLGEHRLNAKQNAYEEALRVPLYVRAPGIAGPQVAAQMTVNVDLAPTIVELAQASAAHTLDGRSFVPLLQNPGLSPWRTAFLVEHKKVSSWPVPDYAAIRDTRYLYVEYKNGQRELYDLATDPHELVSQHNNPAFASIKVGLKQKLSGLRPCVGNACRL